MNNLMLCNDLDKLSNPGQKTADDAWTGDYKQVERLPRQWMSEYILHRAKKLQVDNLVTAETLTRIEEANSQGIPLLFYFETQLSGALAMPPVCSDQWPRVPSMLGVTKSAGACSSSSGLAASRKLGRSTT